MSRSIYALSKGIINPLQEARGFDSSVDVNLNGTVFTFPQKTVSYLGSISERPESVLFDEYLFGTNSYYNRLSEIKFNYEYTGICPEILDYVDDDMNILQCCRSGDYEVMSCDTSDCYVSKEKVFLYHHLNKNGGVHL